MNQILDNVSEYKQRKYFRGFKEFYDQLIPLLEPKVICEFGIGSGHGHYMWAKKGAHAVLGLEYLTYPEVKLGPKGTPLSSEQIDYWKQQLDASQLILQHIKYEFPECNIQFKYGVDAYNAEQVDVCVKESNMGKFDLVIDDAGDRWPLMLPGLDAWKSHISSNGVFITETPDGNGTDFWRNFSKEEHLEHFREYAKKGLVVYDMKEYQPEEYKNNIDYSSTFLGFWAPDFSKFSSLMDKYEHNRVA